MISKTHVYLSGLMGVVLLALTWIPATAGDLPWDGRPVTLDEIVIVLDNPRQRDPGIDWDALVRDIIAMGPGDLLTREKLNAAVSALEAFGHVRTKIEPQPRRARATFLLLPYQRIKKIAFKGLYPLFQRDVQNAMTVAAGDIYDPGSINAQAELIVRRYRAEGYIDPRVNITWEHDESDGHVNISIHIKKGRAFTIGSIHVTGNRALSLGAIKGRMSTWRRSMLGLGKSRLIEARLKADIEKLVVHYRSRGFADVHIEHESARDPVRHRADIRLTIHEGPRYIIQFEGNRHYSDGVLMADLALFEKGNHGNMGLRRSVQSIRRRYLDAGFANIRVQWRDNASVNGSATDRRLRIDIQEGGRQIVERVTIAGNRALSSEAIQAQMLTRPPHGLSKGAYVAAVLQEDKDAIRALYGNHGYLDATVVDTVVVHGGTDQVAVTLTIEEGPQARVGQIRIEGQNPIPEDRLLAALPMKAGAIFQPRMMASGENELTARIASQGYPHIQVAAKAEISVDRSRVDIVYRIDPGPRVEIGQIYWAGNFRTRNTLLAREIQLEQGEPFSLVRVLDAQRRLRDLDLFQSVQMRSIGLKEKAPRVHLLMTVVEKSSYFFELGTGFQTDKGPYGRTKVGDRNFLGLNKEIRLGGEISGIGYRWDADIIEPRLLGSRISADLGLFGERREEFNQDFGIETIGGHVTFARPWGEHLTVSLGMRCERREQFLREKDAATSDVDSENLEPRTLWVTTPAIGYDSRDSFIRPRKGYFANLAADISKGLDSPNDDFIKYRLDLRTYYTVRDRLTLAGRALAGYLQPYGVDGEIPEDQLFFLGGAGDVRGFGENLLRFDSENDPVGGRLSLSGSIEARYGLTPSWELTFFVDAGTVQKAVSGDGGDDPWRWAAGLGVRYITPIGPIGLLYGHKIDPRPGESPGQLHFSVGYTF